MNVEYRFEIRLLIAMNSRHDEIPESLSIRYTFFPSI